MSKPHLPIRVSMAEATPETCECGSEFFKQVFKIMTLSPLVKSNPTGRAITQPQTFMQCIHCQKIWSSK